jgi:hypothetical protein
MVPPSAVLLESTSTFLSPDVKHVSELASSSQEIIARRGEVGKREAFCLQIVLNRCIQFSEVPLAEHDDAEGQRHSSYLGSDRVISSDLPKGTFSCVHRLLLPDSFPR